MKHITFRSRIAVAMILFCFLAGIALGDTVAEGKAKEERGTTQVIAGSHPQLREPLGMPAGKPAVLSPADEALIEALMKARKAGDQARVKEILDIMSPGGEADRIEPVIHPMEGPVGVEDGGAERRWGNDVLVVDTEYTDGSPDMVSSSNGELFLVEEHMDSFSIRIYRSSDGGLNWWWYKNLYSLEYDILDPALAVPEIDQDYLYAIYEYADRIQIARIDLATDEMVYFNVEVNGGGVRRPRIVTDNIDYPGNYWLYVIYIAHDPNNPITSFDIKAARSEDNGETWGYQKVFNSQSFNWISEVDITFGDGRLYAVWDAWETITTYGVFLCRSTNLGNSWDPWVNLTPTDRDCSGPRVGAIQDGQQVTVVYQDAWGIDDIDVRYALSEDAGGTWTKENCLGCSFDHERKPDICVDPSLGGFHAVYWKENDTIYSSAPHTNPTGWTPPLVINDTNQTNQENIPPTVAVHWTSGEACVAWPDERLATNAIYFDRVNLPSSVEPALPTASWLGQNYPNPFNPQTTIVFELASPALTEIAIFDLKGSLVRTLQNESLGGGRHEVIWNGNDNEGHRVASGVYMARMRAGDYTQMKKVMLVK